MPEDIWTPKPGLFRTRTKPRGPWVPVRVWMESAERDEAGEPLADDVMRCEIDGERVDPWQGCRRHEPVGQMPRHLFFIEIDEAEFNYLSAYRQHVRQWGEPEDKALRYKPRKDNT